MVDFDQILDKGKSLISADHMPFRMTANLKEIIDLELFKETSIKVLGVLVQSRDLILAYFKEFLAYDPFIHTGQAPIDDLQNRKSMEEQIEFLSLKL